MAGLFELIVPSTTNEGNPLTNPSMETGITGYTTGGTNTIAQSSEQAYKGLYSAKVTYADNATLASLSVTLSTTTTYYGIARIYVSSNWDASAGSYIRLDFVNYSGATITYDRRFIVGTDTYGTWILLHTTITTAADGSGVLRINIDNAPTAGGICYLDAFKVSTVDSLYFDGDTPGCYWTGTPHASTSVCPSNVRAQGVPTNFDNYGIYFGAPTNTDMAPLSFQSRENPFIPGAEHYRTKVNASSFVLPGEIVGTSYPDTHSKRTTLQKALNKDLLYPEQPFVIRYLGNNEDNPTYYEARLQSFAFQRRGYTDKGLIKMLAERNPYWFEEGEQAVVLDRQDTLSVKYILGFENQAFTAMLGGGTGGTSTVYCTAYGGDGLIYIGGNFTNWDGIAAADYLVSYNPATGTYAAPGSAPNDNVRAVVRMPNGDIILAGDFTSIGGAGHNRIAKLSGGSYSSLGTGANGIVRALCVGLDGKLYAGGDFTAMGGVANTDYIAVWDGTTWAELDNGANGAVYSLFTNQKNGNILMGGDFTQVGSAPLTGMGRVARWTPSTGAWSKVANANFDDTVRSIIVGGDGKLYAGGDFTSPAKVAQVVNGNRWDQMAGGVTGGVVNMVAWSYLYNQLWVGGTFSSAGTNPTIAGGGMALWRGGAWAQPGITIPSVVAVNTYLENAHGDFYFGFSSDGDATLSGAPVTVTNTGGVTAYPRVYIKISGAGTTAKLVSLQNLTTGLNIGFNYTLSEGQTFILDLTPGNKRAYIRENFTQELEVTGLALLNNADFVEWGLLPGSNKIQLRVDDVIGTPTVTAYLLYKRQYATYDGEA